MSARTIDEGSLDEKSGMNFSEYVAILSGNTDLPEKARTERKVAALESERKSFHLNGEVSARKPEDIIGTVKDGGDLTARAKDEWTNYSTRALRDADGTLRNPVELNGVQGSNPKTIGLKLNEIARVTDTGGKYLEIGTLFIL